MQPRFINLPPVIAILRFLENQSRHYNFKQTPVAVDMILTCHCLNWKLNNLIE